MTVYVLQQHFGSEYGEVLGVFASEDAAKSAAATHADCELTWNDGYARALCHQYTVEPFEVKR